MNDEYYTNHKQTMIAIDRIKKALEECEEHKKTLDRIEVDLGFIREDLLNMKREINNKKEDY